MVANENMVVNYNNVQNRIRKLLIFLDFIQKISIFALPNLKNLVT